MGHDLWTINYGAYLIQIIIQLYFQNEDNFGALFICINVEDTNIKIPYCPVLSGKYVFHSMYGNVCAFNRECGKIEGITGEPFFLAYMNGCWYVTDQKSFRTGVPGRFLLYKTKGFLSKIFRSKVITF